MLFRDRLISKTGEFCCLGAWSLMKETDRGTQREEEEEEERMKIGGLLYRTRS